MANQIQSCEFMISIKVVLWSKFRFPVSLQLLKIEVINTYHAKFYIEIPTGRPVILIVKFSFALPPLLDSKTGREPHGELDPVARRGMWRHTLKTTWRAFEWPISLKQATSFYLSGLRCILTAQMFVNIRENSPGDCLDIYDFELCSKGAISSNKSSCFAHRTEAPRTSSWRLRGKLKRKNCLKMLPSWCLPFEDKSRNWAKRLSEDNRK